MNSWQIFKRFIEPIQYAPKSYIFWLFCEIRQAFQTIFTIQIGVRIIAAVEHKDINSVYYRWIVLAIVFFIGYVFACGREIAHEYYSNMIKFSLEKKYLKHFLSLDNTKVEAIGIAKIQEIIRTGISEWSDTITRTFMIFVVEVWAIFYAFVLVASQSPTIYHFLWFLLLSIVSTLFIMIGLRQLGKTREKSKWLEIELARQQIKVLMSKFEVLQNNKFDYELQKQETIVKETISMRQRTNAIKWLRQLWANTIMDGMQVCIYIVVWVSIIYGNYSIAYLSLLLQLLTTTSNYVRSLRGHIKRFYYSKIHVEKLRKTFDTIPSIDVNKWVDFQYRIWDISLHKVSFAYTIENDSIFKDISLHIKWWTKTAFVWESWGGKTTLMKLLAWYIRPDKGEIIIDGQSLSDVKLIDYYRHIGYLTQDPSVFDGTIKENLLYGMSVESGTVHHDSIDKVIKLSKCEFIYDFPQWIDTEIGERWVRLSGWQKQRLAIAKIMLKNPSIILLDEPTSALDSFNEELVNEALHNLFTWKTVIVIAHRLQTVKQADRILYIEAGKIVADGTHDELTAEWWKYKKMLDLQSWF